MSGPCAEQPPMSSLLSPRAFSDQHFPALKYLEGSLTQGAGPTSDFSFSRWGMEPEYLPIR